MLNGKIHKITPFSIANCKRLPEGIHTKIGSGNFQWDYPPKENTIEKSIPGDASMTANRHANAHLLLC
jgi:hypothetical protein